ncbi:hypothetical protein CVS47_03199 [Microbacterium lemovicicum]|uniref:Galactosyltransferase C-terminal domain-containing protein n=2 Tax=Microbacterium lemovicicum TaxID=1072463 RepID=A0A3Q9J1W0_9MICO|nr:galactosyltransferase-related protein [Microbacterium lemovicicum]AZS38541.1 hypothetical protein CVS47_03199 [Microbacterium lemovicicum]
MSGGSAVPGGNAPPAPDVAPAPAADSAPAPAPGRVAVITTASAARHEHLVRQRRFLAEAVAGEPESERMLRVEVWLDSEEPDDEELDAEERDGEELATANAAGLRADISLHVPPGPGGLRVAAGRNAAAHAAIDAGADLLVFLDVDCLPGRELLPRYRDAAARHPEAILSGPVTYLASVQRPELIDDLPALRRPHRARPAPAPGALVTAPDAQYDLFWSLSFALTASTWHRLGGFDESYEGYGAEDTDLAWTARSRGIPLIWVGGADAFHQWHPTSSPPWAHLDAILRNGAVFADRWGTWPMGGWLDAFAAAGAVEHRDGTWRRAPDGPVRRR